MLTKTHAALAVALILSTASLGTVSAFAGGDSGEYHGGFVVPGSTDGVNPVYHPDWFSSHANGSGHAGGRDAYASTKGSKVHRAKGRNAFGLASERGAAGYNGDFINGNFIPRGTSPAQIPSHHEED